MEYEITTKPDREWVLLETFGAYSTPDLYTMLQELAELERPDSITGVLVNHGQTSYENITPAEMDQTAQVIATVDNFFGFKRCAIVVSPDGASFSAMYKYALDSSIHMETKVYSPGEYAQAVSWLENSDSKQN